MTGAGKSYHEELKKGILNMSRFEAIKFLKNKGYSFRGASRACNQTGFKQGDCKIAAPNN